MTGVGIRLRVQPSARTNELVGVRDGVLVARVNAPATEGRANDAVRRLLAKRLRVPRSSVKIVRGHRSRDKVVEIDGLERTSLLDMLAVLDLSSSDGDDSPLVRRG